MHLGIINASRKYKRIWKTRKDCAAIIVCAVLF